MAAQTNGGAHHNLHLGERLVAGAVAVAMSVGRAVMRSAELRVLTSPMGAMSAVWPRMWGKYLLAPRATEARRVAFAHPQA
jgi:hypothetical protein